MEKNCSLKNKKILVTSGPTWVPIDDVRILSNQSTGELGRLIARQLQGAEAKVTLLEGPVPEPTRDKGIKVIPFKFFDELQMLVHQELRRDYDVCIHAAAVSDYQMDKPIKGKMSSRLKRLRLDLVPTAKIIKTIKKQAPQIFLVGFKLEPQLSVTAAKKRTRSLFEEDLCDLVIFNRVEDKDYSAFILGPKGQILVKAASRQDVAVRLIRLLESRLYC